MAAFKTWVRLGLIPHARHEGRGVWMLAVVGSKLDGTGFEKLQIVHTHVAVLAEAGSDKRGGPSWRTAGEEDRFLEGEDDRLGDRVRREARFVGLGTSVILADDLRKPP